MELTQKGSIAQGLVTVRGFPPDCRIQCLQENTPHTQNTLSTHHFASKGLSYTRNLYFPDAIVGIFVVEHSAIYRTSSSIMGSFTQHPGYQTRLVANLMEDVLTDRPTSMSYFGG